MAKRTPRNLNMVHRIGVYLPFRLWKEVQEKARAEMVSACHWIREAIKDRLKKG